MKPGSDQRSNAEENFQLQSDLTASMVVPFFKTPASSTPGRQESLSAA